MLILLDQNGNRHELRDHLTESASNGIRSISGSLNSKCQDTKIGGLWKFNTKEVDEWVTYGTAGDKDDEDPNTTKDKSRYKCLIMIHLRKDIGKDYGIAS